MDEYPVSGITFCMAPQKVLSGTMFQMWMAFPLSDFTLPSSPFLSPVVALHNNLPASRSFLGV